MKLWLLLGLAFLVQEPISTGVILIQVYQLHYNVWLIHLLFSLATLLDIAIGYYLGAFIRKRYGEARAYAWIKTQLEKFASFMGRNGKIVTLVVYAPILFPISGIFVPWLDISLTDGLIYIFIGEIIFWYVPEWLVVLGIKTFVGNPFTALYAAIIIFTLLSVIVQYFSRRRSKETTGI